MPEPTDLVGTFVVEIGERQAWPFVTFADNDLDREYRLFLDSRWSVRAGEFHREFDSVLLQLQGATVSRVDVSEQASLQIDFVGQERLVVSGQPDGQTTSDVWWLSDVL